MVDVQRTGNSAPRGSASSRARGSVALHLNYDHIKIEAPLDDSFYGAGAGVGGGPASLYSAHPSLGLHGTAPVHSRDHSAIISEEEGDEDDDGEELFASYSPCPLQQPIPELTLRPTAWEYYYPQTTDPSASISSSTSSTASDPLLARAKLPSVADPASKLRSSVAPATSRSMRPGVKRPLESVASPTVSIASSMLAMRNNDDTERPMKQQPSPSNEVSTPKQEIGGPANKKTKVSRERQLKINAASRRCRKKQKLELQFLRTHVVELQSALRDQVNHLRGNAAQQQRASRLAAFVEASIQKVDAMSSGARPTTPNATTPVMTGAGGGSSRSEAAVAALAASAPFDLDLHHHHKSGDERSGDEHDDTASHSSSDVINHIETDDASSIHLIDPMTGYSLSGEQKMNLLKIAQFLRVNIDLESRSFCPEVISCLPIEMDGWQLRLSITEKNYTIHNCKFFPCKPNDMFDFCWETNVSQKISIKQRKKHYCVVTPLASDVAHVYSKTIGKWSLAVHGVPNVSYNSLMCRKSDNERAIICQQSVLEERDFQDETTLPWLFKRWVVFQPRVVDGIEGTFVEAYRTASYATGRLIYKDNNTYDSFCEHLIRRYAESNSLLERMMARDRRFQEVAGFDGSDSGDLDSEDATSDRMVKDLLLF